MSRDFSKRYGYGPEGAEITVREDAPAGLRYGGGNRAAAAADFQF
jgi:hypothetical protein